MNLLRYRIKLYASFLQKRYINIFVLDKDPWKIPKHYMDIHVNKMLLESCQLLCNALPKSEAPYKRTHYNHPCSQWVRASLGNFNWLNKLAVALSLEYKRRTSKTHACDKVLEVINQTPLDGLFEETELTPWPKIMPDEFKTVNCPYCGPNKGSVRSNPDGTIIVPLQFLPCMTCNDTGNWNINPIRAYRRYYAAKIWEFRKRGLLRRKKNGY